MTKIIAFDVNETLLDLRGLDPLFEESFGASSMRAQWFALMLQLSFVGGLTGAYVDFSSAQYAALEMLATREGVELPDGAAMRIVGAMNTLPPHPEVADALRTLREGGLPLVALTNSVTEVAEAQLANAGLRELFDDVISADRVQHLKPAPEPYRAVADSVGVPLSQVRLVAAHHWDISGALRAGCAAAFVARPGAMLSPIGPQPDIVGADIRQVVEQILLHR